MRQILQRTLDSRTYRRHSHLVQQKSRTHRFSHYASIYETWLLCLILEEIRQARFSRVLVLWLCKRWRISHILRGWCMDDEKVEARSTYQRQLHTRVHGPTNVRGQRKVGRDIQFHTRGTGQKRKRRKRKAENSTTHRIVKVIMWAKG